MKNLSISIGAALLLFLLSGCGKTKHEVVPVEGTLTFADGKPLPTGTRLSFRPSEGGMGMAEGVTEADGKFTLKHASGRTGAEEGKYIVLLAAPEGDNGSFYKTIPKDYYDGGVLSAEIKKGMPPLEFKVKLTTKK